MKKLMWSALAAAMLGASAHAADLPQPDVVQAPPAEVQVASVSGWYLRGDASYSIMRMRGAHYYITQDATGTVDDGTFGSTKLDNSASVGVGAGYQFNNYLRSDVTLDYTFRTTFNGSTQGGCGVSTACTSRDIAHLTMFSVLANAYVDLGTYGSVTPYVGAGLGATHVSWDGDNNTSCANSGAGCDPTFQHEGRDSWRFTYALMAGASIDVTCNVKADIGYRYRHVNGGPMFGSIYYTGSQANVGPGYDNGFDIHEVRGGLRYQFGNGGCGEVAQVPPAPMPVYK